MKNTPDFPGENSTTFVKWISSFALAKPTFCSKRSKRWRGFPPDGMYMYTCIDIDIDIDIDVDIDIDIDVDIDIDIDIEI